MNYAEQILSLQRTIKAIERIANNMYDSGDVESCAEAIFDVLKTGRDAWTDSDQWLKLVSWAEIENPKLAERMKAILESEND